MEMEEDFESLIRHRVTWETEPSLGPSEYHSEHGTMRVLRGHFKHGLAAGVEVILLDTGAVRLLVLPTRGMGIWRIEAGGQMFGWRSPVAGPVHPALVPVFDPSGLGWLEGFDELLVRCGLESNGAPQHDAAGRLEYPLHGRVANLPASDLSVTFDSASEKLTLEGTVTESKLFFKRLQLRSRLTLTANRTLIEIEDRVTNGLSQPATAQMLYHINLGTPLLAAGGRVRVASEEVRGKDERSESERGHWNEIGAPTSGYAERVYFVTPRSDAEHRSAAMLQGPSGDLGFGITYQTDTLPHLVVWKNTGALPDGYVVGLEPATNLPNTRAEETAAGRVVSLDAGVSVTFRMTLQPLLSAAKVAAFATKHALD